MGDRCESGCSAPVVVRIGGAWLCQECANAMLDEHVMKEQPTPLSHGAVRAEDKE